MNMERNAEGTEERCRSTCDYVKLRGEQDGGVALTKAFRQGLRDRFRQCLIFCGNFTQKSAEVLLSEHVADAVAFGRLYIANPDLVERFVSAASWNEADPSSFYFGNTKGYTDYLTLEESAAS